MLKKCPNLLNREGKHLQLYLWPRVG